MMLTDAGKKLLKLVQNSFIIFLIFFEFDWGLKLFYRPKLEFNVFDWFSDRSTDWKRILKLIYEE